MGAALKANIVLIQLVTDAGLNPNFYVMDQVARSGMTCGAFRFASFLVSSLLVALLSAFRCNMVIITELPMPYGVVQLDGNPDKWFLRQDHSC